MKKITYRPFDNKFFYYDRNVVWRLREKCSQHLISGNNLSLISARSNNSNIIDHFFVSRHVSEAKTGESSKQSSFFPLYRYESMMGGIEEKVPNLDPKIYAKIKKSVPDVTPESLFDYIYAVLHSPAYRKRYAEFLKSDFPRIPYPSDPEIFHALAEKGYEICKLHLMESPLLDNTGVSYPASGDNLIEKPTFDNGKVLINKEQYFDGVSKTAWEFYIGGYQPAQKWLKDRKNRTLNMDDIQHYRKIIKALHETDRIMKEIDQINFLPEDKK